MENWKLLFFYRPVSLLPTTSYADNEMTFHLFVDMTRKEEAILFYKKGIEELEKGINVFILGQGFKIFYLVIHYKNLSLEVYTRHLVYLTLFSTL